MPTTQDLLRFATTQARIEQIDYFDPRYPRADEIAAWRKDRRTRDNARRAVFKQWPARARGNADLTPGKYGPSGRLVITPTEIDYTPGQYSAPEIWDAVADYFRQTNDL